MPLLPKPVAAKATRSFSESVHAPKKIGSVSVNPTTPSLSISNRYLRAGLRGEVSVPKGLGVDNTWHVSNRPTMDLNKIAELSEDTKKELVSTGIIGAMGAGTSALAHRILQSGSVKNTSGRAALLGGGLGLVGDYAAVKLMSNLPDSALTENKAQTMNKVASILRDRAAELRQSTPEIVAIELLKQAGLSDEDARYEVAQQGMEKAAAEQLSYQGIDMEDAARLVKAANINVRELQGFNLVSDEEALANVLEKAAGYIDAQDQKIQSLINNQVTVQAAIEPSLPDSITKMASVGALTFEDLEALKTIPQDTLTKMAGAIEQPWEFGKAAGMSASTGDPILDFCLG